MVIQTNQKEFKGKTLLEYLNWKYPAPADKEGVNFQTPNKKNELGKIINNLKNKLNKAEIKLILTKQQELNTLQKHLDLEYQGKIPQFRNN